MPNATHDLPVYFQLGGHNPPPDVRALLDGCHLQEHGLIDTTADLGEVLRLVADLGQGGCYEAHVRATGVEYRCPDWCVSPDHARRGLYDPQGGAPDHVAYDSAVGVYVGACDGDPIQLDVSVEGALDAAQARRLAAALLDAADVLDQAG
jgi:hypothetical protein